MTRDGKTEATPYGRAAREAAPDLAPGAAAQGSPLLIVCTATRATATCWPSWEENLAGKGYAVASIDHTDSNDGDMGAFGSTLSSARWTSCSC